MNIYTLLQTKTDFTTSEKMIAKYILENPEKVIHMSAQEISEACFVSVTSIYRLATKCGTSGLSDLKVKLSSSLSEYKKMDETFDFDYPIKKYQTHHEMIELLKEDYNQTVLETSHLFDLDTLQGIVQLMDSSHLAMIITFNGRGILSEKIPSILHKNHVPTVLISSTEYHPEIKYYDYQLFLSSKENHYKKMSSYSTRLSLLFVLDTLYTAYFKRHYEDNIEKKTKYYKKMTGE